MSRDVDNQGCAICGEIPYDSERRVLVDGKARRSYCSEACLRKGIGERRIARSRLRLRRYAFVVSLALLAAGVGYARQLLLRWRPPGSGASARSPFVPQPAPEVPPFGPHWPPTDEEWQAELAHAAWVHPLPGPSRRRPSACPRLFVGEPTARARCRSAGRCGVDLGGELWGEHIYAAHDGVVDRLQRSNEDAPSGIYVRVAHWGGAVFTHYVHLAAVPTRLAVGTRVEAGDVIGLLGDTGVADARAHLHFALSIRPSSELPEIYWDPEPLMATWPLRTPERGSVAGLVALDALPERLAGAPSLPRAPSPRAR
jgi:murein DD-endopeptidase MepM/ murein hydrolase activator NlpD